MWCVRRQCSGRSPPQVPWFGMLIDAMCAPTRVHGRRMRQPRNPRAMQLAVVWVRSGVQRCHPNLNLFRILFLERTPPSPRAGWLVGWLAGGFWFLPVSTCQLVADDMT